MKHFQMPLLAVLLLSGTAWGQSYFGQSGQNGYNGRAGYNGPSGQAATVFADGQAQNFDVSGRDGESGEPGGRGEDAYSCFQPTGATNTQGADGGIGGSGGSGGRGGDAGRITAYYDNISDLSLITLRAYVGRGGRGGYGGSGGRGCRCQTSQWQVDGQTYSCSSGREGQRGRTGSDGAYGRSALITLIPQMTSLPREIKSKQISIEEFATQSFTMREHNWERRSGARQIFSSSSKIPDTYFQFLETFEKNIKLTWNNDRDQSAFGANKLYFTLNQNAFNVAIDNTVWFDTTLEMDEESQDVTLSIDHAVHVKEVRSLKYLGLKGQNASLETGIEDTSGVESLFSNKYFVRYYTRGLVFYKLRWQGWISDDFLVKEGTKTMIKLGQLPFHSDFKRSGQRVRLDITVRRESGSRRLDLGFSNQHQIR